MDRILREPIKARDRLYAERLGPLYGSSRITMIRKKHSRREISRIWFSNRFISVEKVLEGNGFTQVDPVPK